MAGGWEEGHLFWFRGENTAPAVRADGRAAAASGRGPGPGHGSGQAEAGLPGGQGGRATAKEG